MGTCDQAPRQRFLWHRVGVEMKPQIVTRVPPSLQFKETWEERCKEQPLQHTEGFNDECPTGTLEHEEEWEM